MTVDARGAAHDRAGRYTGHDRSNADVALTGNTDPGDALRTAINDVFPTAAVAFTARSRPGTGTQEDRLDHIVDAAGSILWDYDRDHGHARNDQLPSEQERDTKMLYLVWRQQVLLRDVGDFDAVAPLVPGPHGRRFQHRNLRAITLNPTEPETGTSRFSIHKIDVDEDYFAQFPIGAQPTLLQRLFRRPAASDLA